MEEIENFTFPPKQEFIRRIRTVVILGSGPTDFAGLYGEFAKYAESTIPKINIREVLREAIFSYTKGNFAFAAILLPYIPRWEAALTC